MRPIRHQKPFFFAICATTILLMLSSEVHAMLAIVDQQQTTNSGLYGAGSALGTGLGQSFTPTQPSVNAADFYIQNLSAPLTLRLDLFAGSGYSGNLLGSSSAITINSSPGAGQTYEFYLTTSVVLSPGNLYTFRLTETAGNNSGFAYNVEYSSNTYAGGTLFNSDGSSAPAYDTVFAEGTAVAPEPSTWMMLVGASCLLLAPRACRHRASRA